MKYTHLLKYGLEPNGSLKYRGITNDSFGFIYYDPEHNDKHVELDGAFSVEELEELVHYMKECQDDQKTRQRSTN